MTTLSQLITHFISQESSDLHVTTNEVPYIRQHGKLVPIPNHPPITHEQLQQMTEELVGKNNLKKFLQTQEFDTATTIQNRRIRINLYIQQNQIAWALRLLPTSFYPLNQLGINPEICKQVTQMHKGLVLVTGATGSGKSTTLASIIDTINHTRHEHIFTIEDPVEYIHKPKRSFISQRQVGADTTTFAEALKRILREDPDVVLIGEMRDRETIEAALTLAETGHLTFGTLHTSEAVQTVTRVIGAFPANQQNQIRTQLSASLKVVFSQQLIPWKNGKGRALAAEILVATPAVQAMIRDNKLHQLNSTIQTGSSQGMITMNQSLLNLVNTQTITQEMALSRSLDKEDMKRKLNI